MNHSLLLRLIACFACFAISGYAQRSATPPERIRLPDGFKIELLYSVPRGDHGSWLTTKVFPELLSDCSADTTCTRQWRP